MGDCDDNNIRNCNVNNVVDDLSIVPLEKDSFAICELCGIVGIRKYFYYRNKKFCSLRCNSSAARRRYYNWKFKLMEPTDHMEGMIPLEPLPQLQTWSASITDLQAGPIKETASIANSYEWKDELFGCDFLAAPVSLFKHAPLNDMWDNTFEGMKVEVKNSDCDYSDKMSDFFWVATVTKVKGYMGLLRYEGFGSDDSKDFWVNLCCSEVHPVGWCATRGKPLIPPRSIEDKYSDWKKFLVKQLTGARTLPANFYSKLTDNLKSRFSVGTVMEVVDKNRISQVKVASVHEIIGKRLHIKYYDSSPEDNGFWCHEDSPLIHPVGWAFRVGHPLDAPQAYCERVATGRLHPKDSTPDMFYKFPSTEPPLFSEGMKLEAIDPLNLSAVCAATVMQILHDGYMMVRIDCYPDEDSGSDWFCYHQRSPCIFPVGFSVANNIPMIPPSGWSQEDFSWELYLGEGRAGGSVAAPVHSFAARSHVVEHGFVAGMRVECADIMAPRLVCVATVTRVVADLLKVHFDGWGEEYDQWVWAHSPDVYPVGWCRAVGHHLEGPLQPPPRPPRRAPRARCRPQRNTRLHRGRRRISAAPAQCTGPIPTNEDNSLDSSQEVPDQKSESPPTSVSEISADVDLKTERSREAENGDQKACSSRMEVDSDISMDSKTHDASSPSKTDDVSPETPAEPEQLHHDEPVVLQEQEQPKDMAIESNDSTDTMEIIVEPNKKVIPRLVNNTSGLLDVFNSVAPDDWSSDDVAEFLTVNDCQPYCVNFSHITGSLMLQLSKDEIIELLEMKVGPSLKIYDLIQQLKCKIRQPQSRLLGSFK